MQERLKSVDLDGNQCEEQEVHGEDHDAGEEVAVRCSSPLGSYLDTPAISTREK